MSPTERSLKHLRAEGWAVHKTEAWNPWARRRVDAFGWGDLLACHPVHGIALVQTTTTANLSARLKKAKGLGALVSWSVAGGKLIAHGWAKRGPRGERKRWTLKVVSLLLEDLIQKEVKGSQAV